MDVALKKNQSFRLSVELIDRLRLLAKGQNRSLNNYVETLLLEAAYHEPNSTTLAAMKEAESGVLRNEPALDLSSVQAMEKSMGLCRQGSIRKIISVSAIIRAKSKNCLRFLNFCRMNCRYLKKIGLIR